MEECGRGAAVEQLTARGMLSIPAMGAIEHRAFSARYFNNRYGVYEGLLLIQKCKGFYLILCYFNDTIPILMKFTWHGNI